MVALRSLAFLSTVLLLPGPAAEAAQAIGTVSGKALHRVDLASGQSALIGTFTTVDPKETEIYFLARAPDNKLYGLSSGQSGPMITNVQSRIYLIDEQTAQLTHLKDIDTVHVAGATIDPSDGSLYYITLSSGPWNPWFGPDNYLMRYDLAGTGAITKIGDMPTYLGQFRDLVFDQTGQLYSLNVSANELWKIEKANPNGPTTGPVGGGLGTSINTSLGASLSQNPTKDKALCLEHMNQKLFHVDLITGTASLPVQLQPPALLDIETEFCLGSVTEVGTGCPGTGGHIPSLKVAGCPTVAQQIDIEVRNGLGGALAFMFLGVAGANLPLGGGCVMYLLPLPQLVVFPLGGVGPSAGEVNLPVIVPPAAASATAHLQVFLVDPGGSIGYSGTNAVIIAIP